MVCLFLLLCGIGISIGTEKATGIGNYLFLGRLFIIFDTTVIGGGVLYYISGEKLVAGMGEKENG